MTNKPDELEQAVELILRNLFKAETWALSSTSVRNSDLRALLSERAELLAAVERMRVALERIADPRNIHFAGDAQVVARAALTTGEGEMSNIVPTVEDLFRLQVAHGMEKSMSLKDPGGWPDYGEVTQHIDRMDNSEFLFAISMAIEDRLAPDAGEEK